MNSWVWPGAEMSNTSTPPTPHQHCLAPGLEAKPGPSKENHLSGGYSMILMKLCFKTTHSPPLFSFSKRGLLPTPNCVSFRHHETWLYSWALLLWRILTNACWEPLCLLSRLSLILMLLRGQRNSSGSM